MVNLLYSVNIHATSFLHLYIYTYSTANMYCIPIVFTTLYWSYWFLFAGLNSLRAKTVCLQSFHFWKCPARSRYTMNVFRWRAPLKMPHTWQARTKCCLVVKTLISVAFCFNRFSYKWKVWIIWKDKTLFLRWSLNLHYHAQSYLDETNKQQILGVAGYWMPLKLLNILSICTIFSVGGCMHIIMVRTLRWGSIDTIF